MYSQVIVKLIENVFEVAGWEESFMISLLKVISAA